mgnify:CR=1 FL=1
MNNIDNLLNNYFDGTASPEEENVLKNYFRSDNISPQHEMYKPMFAGFDKEKQIAAPAFVIPLERDKEKQSLSRKLWITIASTAAVILLVITLFPFKNQSEMQSDDYTVFINGKEITNPQKAQQYADKMFMQANEIIRTSYEPFVEVNAMQTEMDADKIFDNVYRKINYTESENQ